MTIYYFYYYIFDFSLILILVVFIKIKSSSDCPTKICNNCLKKITEFETFKLQVLAKHKQLESEEVDTGKSDNKEEYIIEPESTTKPPIDEVIPELDYVAKGIILRIEKLNKTSFQCAKCHSEFSNVKKLTRHLQQSHNIFQCDECDLDFKTKWQFLKHARIVHMKAIAETKELKTCTHCGKVLKGNNHLNFHIRTKHLKLTKYTCDLCDFRSYGKYEIRSHIEIHHLPLELRKEFPCDLCPSVLTTLMSLKIHKTHKHSKLRPHHCFCGKSFSLKETLKTHISELIIKSKL